MSEMKNMKVSTIKNVDDVYWVELNDLGNIFNFYIRKIDEDYDELEVALIRIGYEEEEKEIIFKSDLKLKLPESDNLEPFDSRYRCADISEAITEFEDNFEKNFEEMKEKLKWYERYDEIRKIRQMKKKNLKRNIEFLKDSIKTIESSEKFKSAKKMKMSEE